VKAKILVWTSLFFIGGYLFLTNFPLFKVKSIVFKGDYSIEKDVQSRLLSSYVGKNIFGVFSKDIQRTIKKDPKVKEAKIEKRYPSQILIDVFKKKPVFLVNLDDIYGLTENKEIIPLFEKGQTYSYPIITGLRLSSFNFYRQMTDRRIDLATRIYQAIKEVDPALFANISEISLRDVKNPVLFLLPYGVRVILGTGNYLLKTKRLKSILAQEDLEEIKTIDLRFKSQALVKKR